MSKNDAGADAISDVLAVMRKSQLRRLLQPGTIGKDYPQFQAFSRCRKEVRGGLSAYQMPRFRPFHIQVQIGG